jgi:hypothetical protein
MTTSENHAWRPILVDEVDQLVEFVDPPQPVPMTQTGSQSVSLQPVLVDEVDQLVEFREGADQPLQTPASLPVP